MFSQLLTTHLPTHSSKPVWGHFKTAQKACPLLTESSTDFLPMFMSEIITLWHPPAAMPHPGFSWLSPYCASAQTRLHFTPQTSFSWFFCLKGFQNEKYLCPDNASLQEDMLLALWRLTIKQLFICYTKCIQHGIYLEFFIQLGWISSVIPTIFVAWILSALSFRPWSTRWWSWSDIMECRLFW